MRHVNFKFWLMAAVFAFVSCSKDDDDNKGGGNDGKARVYVVNEGPFMSGHGTLTAYEPQSQSTEDEVYLEKNGFPIGSIFQSMSIHDGRAYMVANLSAKVEVAESGSFESVKSVPGFSSPRYFLGIDENKAYVSDWQDNNLKVLDLDDLSVSGSIAVGTGPERMILSSGGDVFVANSGGFSTDNTVSVVDPGTDNEVSKITVGDIPNSLVEDANGDIWVLCAGIEDFNDPDNDTPGELYRLGSTGQVEESFTFPGDMHPAKLCIDGNGTTMFFLSAGYGADIWSMDISDASLPSGAWVEGNFYGLGCDTQRDEIYASDAGSFDQNGTAYRYDMDGNVVHSFEVGVAPGNFAFDE